MLILVFIWLITQKEWTVSFSINFYSVLLAALVQFLLNKANLTETQESFKTNILNADPQMRGPGIINRDR
jgi:hypothetical protein